MAVTPTRRSWSTRTPGSSTSPRTRATRTGCTTAGRRPTRRSRSAAACCAVYTPDDQDSDPDGPDNITVSAYGGLILAEDGEGKQHLVGSTESGEAFFFARNEIEGDSEFTGPTFSNDKKILFANIQEPGYVFAISGPFTRQR